MKGQRLSELMNDIDDDLLTDAMPPAWQTGKVKAPKQKRHPLRALGRIMDSGWTAAVLSIVVAAGVLIALVSVGQNAAHDPAPQPGSSLDDASEDQPGAQPNTNTNGLTDTSEDLSKDDASAGRPAPDLDDAPNDSMTAAVSEEDPSPDQPGDFETTAHTADMDVNEPVEVPLTVWMHINTDIYTDNAYGLGDGFMLWRSTDPVDPNNVLEPGYDADGLGAYLRLAELAEQGLITAAAFVPTHCAELKFTGTSPSVTIQGIRVCRAEGDYASLHTESDDRLKTSVLRELGEDRYILIISARTVTVTDTLIIESEDEYPVYVTIEAPKEPIAASPVESLPPTPVTDAPGKDVIFDADAVDKALFGGMDPEKKDDITAFQELYCPDVSLGNAAAMVKLIRALPVPTANQLPPTEAYYKADEQQLVYTYFYNDYFYEYTLYCNGSRANDALERIVQEAPLAFDTFTVISHTAFQTEYSSLYAWLVMDGILVDTCVMGSDYIALEDAFSMLTVYSYTADGSIIPPVWEPTPPAVVDPSDLESETEIADETIIPNPDFEPAPPYFDMPNAPILKIVRPTGRMTLYDLTEDLADVRTTKVSGRVTYNEYTSVAYEVYDEPAPSLTGDVASILQMEWHRPCKVGPTETLTLTFDHEGQKLESVTLYDSEGNLLGTYYKHELDVAVLRERGIEVFYAVFSTLLVIDDPTFDGLARIEYTVCIRLT